MNKQQAELPCQMGIPSDQTGYHVSAGERIDNCNIKFSLKSITNDMIIAK